MHPFKQKQKSFKKNSQNFFWEFFSQQSNFQISALDQPRWARPVRLDPLASLESPEDPDSPEARATREARDRPEMQDAPERPENPEAKVENFRDFWSRKIQFLNFRCTWQARRPGRQWTVRWVFILHCWDLGFCLGWKFKNLKKLFC